MRYTVDVRVGAGGSTFRVGDSNRRNTEATCRCNGVYNTDGVRGSTCDERTVEYEDGFAPVVCSGGCLWCYVQPGACSDGLTSSSMPGNEYSALACAGVTAEVPLDGVTTTSFWVLPPGATDTSQAVATSALVAADMGLGFTAAATGDFTARVLSYEGSGPVTLTATAVGTAEHRSPPLRADGRPHPLEVSCRFEACAFGYDGASAYDGDGSGYDLVRDCFALTVVTCSCDLH